MDWIHGEFKLQNDAETENIDVLTDQKIKGGKHCHYVIERNWEFIEGLKCSRLSYGMSMKPAAETPVPTAAENVNDDDDDEEDQPKAKRSKHIRFK